MALSITSKKNLVEDMRAQYTTVIPHSKTITVKALKALLREHGTLIVLYIGHVQKDHSQNDVIVQLCIPGDVTEWWNLLEQAEISPADVIKEVRAR